MKFKEFFVFALLLFFMELSFGGVTSNVKPLLPVYNEMSRVSDSWKYDEALARTWQGIRKRLVDSYEIPLVHRPKSEQPGDAVSEGIGYGLICALYANDQEGFNKIWNAAENFMWTGKFYNWRVDVKGKVIGEGAATDAEEDIACMLVFAAKLVEKGVWSPFTSSKGASYSARAQNMIESIWSLMVVDGKHLDPGSGWSKGAFVNPGYFSPAYYRVFEAYQPGRHDWRAVIDQGYRTLAASPGYAKGLVPDWMTPDGRFSGDILGYNTYADGKFMYKDAIRMHWRMGLDYLWFKESRAKVFLDQAMAFVGNANRADFYQMDGSPVTESYVLGNGQTRTRKEHSHLTVGMWAPVGLVSGSTEVALSFSQKLMSFYEPGADYWGKAQASDGEDTLHNEMYFDQFLAWFGAATISGVFSNIAADVDKLGSVPKLSWTTALNVLPQVANGGSVDGYSVSGKLSTGSNWTAVISGAEGSLKKSFVGSGTEININWNGKDDNGQSLPLGSFSLVFITRGLGLDTLIKANPILGSIKKRQAFSKDQLGSSQKYWTGRGFLFQRNLNQKSDPIVINPQGRTGILPR